LHGYCVGMGMTLAMHCDLRLAARNTVLGYPEVKHGMISAVSAMHLPLVMPAARAMEMLLMARNVPAEEAERWGLVNAVVDDVLVRVVAAGICHHDLLSRSGRIPGKAGRILGHEIAGEIVAVGAGVAPMRVGETVVLYQRLFCGSCRHCLGGRQDLCRGSRVL